MHDNQNILKFQSKQLLKLRKFATNQTLDSKSNSNLSNWNRGFSSHFFPRKSSNWEEKESILAALPNVSLTHCIALLGVINNFSGWLRSNLKIFEFMTMEKEIAHHHIAHIHTDEKYKISLQTKKTKMRKLNYSLEHMNMNHTMKT